MLEEPGVNDLDAASGSCSRGLTYQPGPESNVLLFNAKIADHEIHKGKEKGGRERLGNDDGANDGQRPRNGGHFRRLCGLGWGEE